MKIVLIDYFPKILGMKKPNNKNSSSNNKLYLTESNEINVNKLKNDYEVVKSQSYLTSNEFSAMSYNLESILNELKSVTQRLKDEDEEEEQSLNWKFAAMVIDRLCMYVFAIATLISTVVILFTSPNLYKSSDPDPIF